MRVKLKVDLELDVDRAEDDNEKSWGIGNTFVAEGRLQFQWNRRGA